MASLTFFGGAGEIGGNKILLEDEKAKAYLDFGESFNFGSDYFYEYLQPRTVNGLECLFEFGLIPKVRRLYNKGALRFTDLKYEKPDIDGVFVSHHHGDHVGHLSFLDEGIPVYMGHGTARIIEAYHNVYPQLVDMGEHNKLNLFRSGDEIEVKHLVFRPIHVEHSTPGAYGYVIERDDGAIVFTGDFRRHGPMQEYTDEFISEASKSRPYCMLCEGTRMTPDPERDYSEKQVYEKVEALIGDIEGLVFAEFAMSNVDRLNSFIKATKENSRAFVIDPKMAYIIDSLRDKVPGLPDPRTSEDVKVYYRLAGSCSFCEKDYKKAYEKEFFENRITYKELKKDPDRFVLHTNFNKLMELIYLQPIDSGYIYSSSEHFLEGDENRDKREVLNNWLRHFGIELYKAHCSGHAGRRDIEHAVKMIKPDILIPIHTQEPEEFLDFHSDVRIPTKGCTLEI